MTVTVCFDALGTCFSLEPVVNALDELLGDELRQAGSCPRMTIQDWFHSAQRDYTYRSITSPPPPPISQFLTLSLPRALTVALGRRPSHAPSQPLPDLSPVTSKLAYLSPQPGLAECYQTLRDAAHANIIIITNGTRSTTEGYVRQAGLEDFVDSVRSCDEVGLAKPFAKVYIKAHDACLELEGKNAEGQEKGSKARWFVAAHLWDLAAARKAGFKTAYVLAEQPPLGTTPDGKDQMEAWYDLFGGEPDIIGADLAEVGRKIAETTK